VLLGTARPGVIANGRAKSANLIVANGVPYVGMREGVAHQLVRAGVGSTRCARLITHHHSDHNPIRQLSTTAGRGLRRRWTTTARRDQR